MTFLAIASVVCINGWCYDDRWYTEYSDGEAVWDADAEDLGWTAQNLHLERMDVWMDITRENKNDHLWNLDIVYICYYY